MAACWENGSSSSGSKCALLDYLLAGCRKAAFDLLTLTLTEHTGLSLEICAIVHC